MSVASYKRAGFDYFFEKMLRVMLEAQDPYFSSLVNRTMGHYLRSLGVEDGVICTKNGIILVTRSQNY